MTRSDSSKAIMRTLAFSLILVFAGGSSFSSDFCDPLKGVHCIYQDAWYEEEDYEALNTRIENILNSAGGEVKIACIILFPGEYYLTDTISITDPDVRILIKGAGPAMTELRAHTDLTQNPSGLWPDAIEIKSTSAEPMRNITIEDLSIISYQTFQV